MPTVKQILGLGDEEDEHVPSELPPQEKIARLRAAAWRFDPALPPPFSRGDLVTVREDCPFGGRGHPYLVLEVRPDAPLEFYGGNTNLFGVRLTVRILGVCDDDLVTAWMEHGWLEPYAGEGTTRN